MTTIIAFLILASTTFAAEPKVHRDLPYAEPKTERQTLDVYAPTEGKDHPIVFWIHGGGWRRGDKASVQQKPQAFVDKGFVFVSTNYRFVPDVTVEEQTGDIANSIKWIHDHAKDYGGSPDMIFVAGHSAGAHLAALVCTDERYLKAEGLSLSNIKGCIPVDTAAYDVPKRMKLSLFRAKRLYTSVFGEDEKRQEDLSPIAHVEKDKGIPPFLILHVADRLPSKVQSETFAKVLRDAGVHAQVVAAEDKTHGTINHDLGLADDPPTKAVFEFLEGVLRPRTLDDFKAKLDKTFTPARAEAVFGKPDRNIGSGLTNYEYTLADGTKLWLGFPGFDRITYAKHVKQDGTTENLPLE